MQRVSVRRFEREDIDFAHEMTSTEQWNMKRNDVARMFDFEPEGCFIAEVGREPVGHVFSITYGKLGWIGLLIVSSKHRRSGIGTVLMNKTLHYLLTRRVETVELDAAPEIADLYRKLGFVDEYDSLRLMATNQNAQAPRSSSVEPIGQGMIEDIARFDAGYFGEYRGRVLSRLFGENPRLSFVSYLSSHVIGYVTCREAEDGYALGPWVCDVREYEVAEELFATCASNVEPGSKIHVGVPSPNTAGVNFLLNHGFMLRSKSIHMRFGGKLQTERPDGIFAIAGAMKG
jgi:GNAT superfamily N-acetyltransferase